jgi:mono/diheme cytochrome c family protein
LKGFDFADGDSVDTYENEAKAWTWNPLKMNIEATKEEDGAITRQNLTLANAKKIYAANCMHCHGEKGDGNGPMMQSQAFSGVPDYKNVADLSNGQIFYSIYYGKGMMGSHASQLNKKEIWSLVHYIRKFQDGDYDKAAMESVVLKEGQESVLKTVAVKDMPASTEEVEENETETDN